MELKDYFESHNGISVLSTADKAGRANSALYSKPYFIEKDKVAFIMAERLTYANIKENPWACYLFLEKGPGYKGKRLYLKMLEEREDLELMKNFCRRCHSTGDLDEYLSSKHLVIFKIEKELPVAAGDKT